MKKIIISLISAIFALHAADDASIEQKQKIMFDQLRPQTMPSSISPSFIPIDPAEKSLVIEILKNCCSSGSQGYERGKKSVKKIFCVIQASPDLKIAMEGASVLESLYVIDLLKECKNLKQILQQVKQNLDVQPDMPFIFNFVQRISYAYQLQQKFNLPLVQETRLDHWYQERMQRSFEVMQKAIIEGNPIVFDPNKVLAEFPPLPIEDQQMQKLIKLHIKTSKRVIQQELLALD
jgi:hypothetical protein